jgi:hypothetical protein
MLRSSSEIKLLLKKFLLRSFRFKIWRNPNMQIQIPATSSELLAQVINAFATHARIPKQLMMTIPGHWMLACSDATMHLLLDLLLVFTDVETHRIVRGFNGSLLFVSW